MKRSELKEIIKEEIKTFFENGLDDLEGPTDAEVGKEKGIASQYSAEMEKQNMRKFIQHMKDIGIMGPDGKLLDAGQYKAHFVNFKADPVEYIESFIDFPPSQSW